MRRREEEEQPPQVRRRNKIHLAICCCLKNCAATSSPPPCTQWKHCVFSFSPRTWNEKRAACLAPPPLPSAAIIPGVMFSGLCRSFLYAAAFRDPSSWVRACQNPGQNVLAARSLLKSSSSLYSTSFHLQLLQFDKEQVQLVFTAPPLETYIYFF